MQDMKSIVGNEVQHNEFLTSVLDEVIGLLHACVTSHPGKLHSADIE
jgi:hypothetical protein